MKMRHAFSGILITYHVGFMPIYTLAQTADSKFGSNSKDMSEMNNTYTTNTHTLVSQRFPKSVFIAPIRAIGTKKHELQENHIPKRVLNWIKEELQRQSLLFRSVTSATDIKSVSPDKVEALVSHQLNNNSAQALKKLLYADFLLYGSVAQINGTLFLTFSLVDLKTMIPVNRVSTSIDPPVGSWLIAEQDIQDALEGTWLSGSSGKEEPTSIFAKLFRIGVQRLPLKLANQQSTKIAVFGLHANEVDKSLVNSLNQLLLDELQKYKSTQIISHTEIKRMLGAETARQLVTGACAHQCLVGLGRHLHANYGFTGWIKKLGHTFFMGLQLLDITTGEIKRNEALTFRGPPTELTRAIRTLARRLLGTHVKGTGTVTISSSVRGADITINNQNVGKSPITLDDAFPARRLNMYITKSGYRDWQSDVFVQPNERNTVWAELQSAPKGLLTKWWFWTIAGAVVAGGTTAVVIATQQSPDSGTGSVSVSTTSP